MNTGNALDLVAGLGLVAFFAGLYLWFGLAPALTVGGLFVFIGAVYLAARMGSKNVGDDSY